MKQINGEPVLFNRWARQDLDITGVYGNRPIIPQGAKVFVVQEYVQRDEALYNFFYRGKVYHASRSLFSDVPPDPVPSTALTVRTAEQRA